MAADEPARYSKNRQELYEYAEEKTETIGYVEKEQAWIRINDNELLVLGEHHAKTTLPDVVRAVGTKRWMHERYSELPLWIFEGHTNLARLQPVPQLAIHLDRDIREDGLKLDAQQQSTHRHN